MYTGRKLEATGVQSRWGFFRFLSFGSKKEETSPTARSGRIAYSGLKLEAKASPKRRNSGQMYP